jgi:hypothetical protein
MNRTLSILILIQLILFACSLKPKVINETNTREFSWTDFEVDESVRHCRSISLFKPIAEKTYLCLESDVYFNYNDSLFQSSKTLDLSDLDKGELDIWIEDRSDCYGVPEMCSDTPYTLIDEEGNIIECNVVKLFPVSGTISVAQFGMKLHFELSKVEWRSNNGEKTVTDRLEFGIIMTGSRPG